MRLTCKIYQKNDKKIFLVGELIDFMNICFVPVRILPACNNSILSLLSLLSFLSLLTVSLNQRHFPFSNFNSSSNAPYFTLKINHRNNGLRNNMFWNNEANYFSEISIFPATSGIHTA